LAVLTGSKKSASTEGAGIRYEIAEMHMFDLFPQTYHIETLVRLKRAP
jgi:tRNA/tmRNA/rRNA uracil-C5-methylase (TrmA/RlmC/RlmD family)